MRLSQLKKDSVMTRKFAYPPEAKQQDRFTVSLHYLSPALFEEKKESVKVKVVNGGKKRSEDVSEAELKRLLVSEILVHTIEKVEEVTINKLRKIIPMSPDAIAASGGLEAAVPMDPAHADQSQRDAAKDNLIFLLNESNDFLQWVLNVSTDLGNFQDDEWEEQVANLKLGQTTNTALA